MSLLRKLPALQWAQRCLPAASALPRAAGLAGAQPAAAFSASAQVAPADNPFYAVPEGHQHSDLSDTACNIGARPGQPDALSKQQCRRSSRPLGSAAEPRRWRRRRRRLSGTTRA